MINDLQLELVAATWFRVQNDDFVNFRYDFDQEEVCPERYAACSGTTTETSGASKEQQVSFAAILSLIVILSFFV